MGKNSGNVDVVCKNNSYSNANSMDLDQTAQYI